MKLALTLVPSDDPRAISPKVSRPTWALLLASAILGLLQAVTPDMLAGLGEWAGMASLALGAVIQFITGYLANDPARQGPCELPEAEESEPAPARADSPAPTVDPDAVG